MGIFSGMEKYGLSKYENAKVIEKKDKTSGITGVQKSEYEVELTEEAILFDKKYKCPICDFEFVSKCVRTGKLKIIGKDSDLRPLYDKFDPLKYDAITCEKCGYSAISKYYGKVSTRQIKSIAEYIGKEFKGINNHLTKFTYEDAIARHKLALVTSVVKDAKDSEKAYTCLKLAWVLRGKRLCLDKNDAEAKRLLQDEMECISNVYEGFTAAISSEVFPIAGMDEFTLKYIMADCARKLKKFEEAERLVGTILVSRNASQRVKNEALNLKDAIRNDYKASRVE
ncbi:MAG: DUF2225 domain-containing protein [Lachnospiraceae bacterium]|nr:DUF2225 domain-containing protein [Lachnospiraceae bacterium]